MRPLEIVISILLAGFLLWPHPQPLIVQLAPAAALITILVHFTLEGYRWQMIPLYVLALILTRAFHFYIGCKASRVNPNPYPGRCFNSIAYPFACSEDPATKGII